MNKEINRVVEKNKEDWNAYSAKYLKYNHSDKNLQPILSDPSSAFEKIVWRQIQKYVGNLKGKKKDIMNAIINSGIQVAHIEEFQDEKNYDEPFWIRGEDIVNGVTVSKEEVDRMYNWEYNPGIAIPTWLSVVGKRR